jgi:hypothetical protein
VVRLDILQTQHGKKFIANLVKIVSKRKREEKKNMGGH